MREKVILEFKQACKEYLVNLSLDQLRAYGRSIGVSRPTTKSKEDLVELILGILAGEIEPIPVAKVGAPVKNNYVDPKIVEEIDKRYNEIASRYTQLIAEGGEEDFKWPENIAPLDVATAIEEFRRQGKFVLRVSDPKAEGREVENPLGRAVYAGQVETIKGISMLLSANCQNAEGIIIPVEMMRAHDLRDGDYISCYVEKSRKAMICVEILMINGVITSALQRLCFEEAEVCFPYKRIHTLEEGKTPSVTAKYFEWLIPLARGQRCCFYSAPKAGKTVMIQELAKALAHNKQKLKVFALLVDQSPENVSVFRKIMPSDQLVYTTYDDDPKRQVFVAEFILKRAKRLVESGEDVVVLIDSLSALARAYNETDESMGGRTLAGGLESKTLYYIKKYLGAARCMEKGGSLTILSSVSCATGNPFDDALSVELSSISNVDVWLDEKVAQQRIYPAIDMKKTLVKNSELFLSDDEANKQRFAISKAIEKGAESVREILNCAQNFEEFIEKL